MGSLIFGNRCRENDFIPARLVSSPEFTQLVPEKKKLLKVFLYIYQCFKIVFRELEMKIHLKSRANKILEATPYDEWVNASDIATKIDFNSTVVGQIISNRLINIYIDRILENAIPGISYVYKRKNR